MRVVVQKWGNSLALRIPKPFAAETAIGAGSEVDLTIEDGRLVITPGEAVRYTLDGLLSAVSAANLHGEHETGPGVGAEAR